MKSDEVSSIFWAFVRFMLFILFILKYLGLMKYLKYAYLLAKFAVLLVTKGVIRSIVDTWKEVFV